MSSERLVMIRVDRSVHIDGNGKKYIRCPVFSHKPGKVALTKCLVCKNLFGTFHNHRKEVDRITCQYYRKEQKDGSGGLMISDCRGCPPQQKASAFGKRRCYVRELHNNGYHPDEIHATTGLTKYIVNHILTEICFVKPHW